MKRADRQGEGYKEGFSGEAAFRYKTFETFWKYEKAGH